MNFIILNIIIFLPNYLYVFFSGDHYEILIQHRYQYACHCTPVSTTDKSLLITRAVN